MARFSCENTNSVRSEGGDHVPNKISSYMYLFNVYGFFRHMGFGGRSFYG